MLGRRGAGADGCGEVLCVWPGHGRRVEKEVDGEVEIGDGAMVHQ